MPGGGSWTLTERGAGKKKKKKGSFFVFRKPLSCSRRVKRVITVMMLLWINSSNCRTFAALET